MEKKNKFIFGAFLFSLILLTGIASGAITFITPSTAGDTVTGVYAFNVSSDLANVKYCNWSTNANTEFASGTNKSDDIFNVTIDTTTLTEVEDTTLTVNCSNDTGNSSEIGTLVINIDNTGPICSFSLPVGEETIEYMSAYGTYPVDASTDTTDLDYAWVLYDLAINSQATSTSQTPNFEGEDFDEIGEFTLELKVTDEASNQTVCTNQTIMVRGTDEDVGAIVIGEFIQERKTEIIVISLVVLLVVIFAGAFLVIKAKKK